MAATEAVVQAPANITVAATVKVSTGGEAVDAVATEVVDVVHALRMGQEEIRHACPNENVYKRGVALIDSVTEVTVVDVMNPEVASIVISGKVRGSGSRSGVAEAPHFLSFRGPCMTKLFALYYYITGPLGTSLVP